MNGLFAHKVWIGAGFFVLYVVSASIHTHYPDVIAWSIASEVLDKLGMFFFGAGVWKSDQYYRNIKNGDEVRHLGA